MEEHQAAESPSTGYVVAMIGALGFVVGCFVPYAEAGTPHSLSLYRLITMRQAALAAAGSHFYLFAGATAIALISLAGLRKPGAWVFPALAAAAIVWSLTWIGILLGGYGFYSSMKVGYWLMAVSIAVVVIGTVLVWLSVRGNERR